MAKPIPQNERPRPENQPSPFSSRFSRRLPPRNEENGEGRPNPFGRRPDAPAPPRRFGERTDDNAAERPSPFGRRPDPPPRPPAPRTEGETGERPSPFGRRPSSPRTPPPRRESAATERTGSIRREGNFPTRPSPRTERPTPAPPPQRPAPEPGAAPEEIVEHQSFLQGPILSFVMIGVAVAVALAIVVINPVILPAQSQDERDSAQGDPTSVTWQASAPVNDAAVSERTAPQLTATPPPVVTTVATSGPTAIPAMPVWDSMGMPTGVQAQVIAELPLRLRAGPGVEFARMQNPGVLMPDAIVDVVGQNADGTWLRINVILADGGTGSAWISAEFVSLISQTPVTLPVVE